MKKINEYCKTKIRRWLGIPSLEADLWRIKTTFNRLEETWQKATAEIQDVSIKGNTRIVVASNLGNGYCRTYELKMSNLKEVVDFCEMLARREVSCQQPYIDAPYDIREFLNEERSRRGLPKGKRKKEI